MAGKNTVDNRKIFFLHPQAVIQDELVRGLIADDYEAYLLRNSVSAKMVLREYPDSILIVQVDSGLSEDQWLEYAAELRSTPVFSKLTLCVVSVAGMEAIQKTYLDTPAGFSYGFSYSGYDFGTIYPRIKEMLIQEKANPPRISIKGTAAEKQKVSVVFTRDQNRYEGRLKDISLSGLTCRLDSLEPLYPSEVPIQAIIITYDSTQFTVSGRIAGNQGDDDSIHLILFDDYVRSDKKDDIFDLIHACLQAQIDALIKEKNKKGQLITKMPRSRLYRK